MHQQKPHIVQNAWQNRTSNFYVLSEEDDDMTYTWFQDILFTHEFRDHQYLNVCIAQTAGYILVKFLAKFQCMDGWVFYFHFCWQK